jgi:Protein of unknown function (DUF1579)
MISEPQKEHEWLQRLLGEWTYETEAVMQPGQPPAKCEGSESVRSLGGLWIMAEGRSEMPGGGPATMIMTLGYDPQKGRYVGTWVGSMMTHLWTYEGELDKAGDVLTLNAEGPSFTGDGKMVKYQDIIACDINGRRTLTSHLLGEDGKWHEFMSARYQRKS